ncbi:MAG: ATP synthase F1 subunit delta [Candidatus Izemoplasma sp.]|nr:ATP synthase F1 subunit delta [Candidatus Izemoplasma sp.]
MSLLGFQYAEALFSLANEAKKADNIYPLFDTVLTQIDRDSHIFLTHPNVPKEDKKTVIAKMSEDELFRHFLFVLIDNNRLNELNNIKDEYKTILDKQNKLLEVTVYSRKNLSDTEKDRVIKDLKQKTNRDISLKNVVDESIVGGLRIEYEGYILDDTINNYLHSLKANLKK